MKITFNNNSIFNSSQIRTIKRKIYLQFKHSGTDKVMWIKKYQKLLGHNEMIVSTE